jgi:beta-glucosidase
MKPVATGMAATLDASSLKLPPGTATVHPLVIRYDGSITAPETGDYNLGLKASGFFRVQLDGKNVTNSFDADPSVARLGRVHLEAGKPAILHVDYSPRENSKPNAVLEWSKVDLSPNPEAIEAAKNADVVVAVLGITSELEGEEMQVSEPGFKGGDRTSLDLPKPEEDLLKALTATGKPVVLVLTNGSALAINWANDHVNAILDAWYPGEEGGNAVAETLAGKNNPAGRLPVTFYKSADQLPPFEDYSMTGRTYRYFKETPLYPFGYGLSYTKFSYSDLRLPSGPVTAGQPMTTEVTVTNTGDRAGDEVAQLYLSFPDVAGAPIRALRGFHRIHLDPGQSEKVHFELTPRDMSMVTWAGEIMIPPGTYSVSAGGGQPNSGAQIITGSFKVQGTMTLPE